MNVSAVNFDRAYKAAQLTFELELAGTHWNPIDRSMTASPPVLSPSSILPPCSSHCSFTPARNNLAHFPKTVFRPIVVVYFTALFRALASSRTRLLDHTQRRVTVGRTPLNECSVRRRDLYLKTHNTHNRQTSMPRVGFEPTIAAGERS